MIYPSTWDDEHRYKSTNIDKNEAHLDVIRYTRNRMKFFNFI